MGMPVLKLEFEEVTVEDRLGRLESTVEHIQSDVSEIKGDIRRLDNKIDRVADKVDALKATYIKRQDDEKDSANQKALARAKKVDAILMRVLMALTILLWAGILVSFFVPVPQQSGRPPTAAR
jgi:chromosome segregation ATPase